MGTSIKLNDEKYIDISSIRNKSTQFNNLTPFGADSRYIGQLNLSSADELMNRLGATESVGLYSLINTTDVMINGEQIGNRQYFYGWLNSTRNYGHALIMTYKGIWYGTRIGSTTTTWTKLT